MSDINLEKLKKQERIRRKNREKCFDAIKKLCLKKIEIVAKTGNSTCLTFKVPMFMFGYPSYKIEKATDYLIKKIEKRGFNTFLYKKNELIIFWNLDDE